eukprot:scaffold6067_cov112-Isochrysis_galbana.AAC.25
MHLALVDLYYLPLTYYLPPAALALALSSRSRICGSACVAVAAQSIQWLAQLSSLAGVWSGCAQSQSRSHAAARSQPVSQPQQLHGAGGGAGEGGAAGGVRPRV